MLIIYDEMDQNQTNYMAVLQEVLTSEKWPMQLHWMQMPSRTFNDEHTADLLLGNVELGVQVSDRQKYKDFY